MRPSNNKDGKQQHHSSYNNVKQCISVLAKYGFKPLAKMLYTLLKKNPYEEGSRKYMMWNEQAGINIPLLYLASIKVLEYADELKIKHLLFVTRDCIHWHRIFTSLFRDRDFKITYFDSSRIMFQEAIANKNKYYAKYIQDCTGGDISKSMYIDVHGTCKNLIAFSQKQYGGKVPACFLLTIGAKTYREMPKECYTVYKKKRLIGCLFDKAGSPIEMLNYDKIGSLVNYDKNGPVRMDPEYDIRIVEPYHKCVSTFLKIHENTPPYHLVYDKVDDCIQFLGRRITKRKHQPIINKWITHTRKHEIDAKKFNRKNNNNQTTKIKKRDDRGDGGRSHGHGDMLDDLDSLKSNSNKRNSNKRKSSPRKGRTRKAKK